MANLCIFSLGQSSHGVTNALIPMAFEAIDRGQPLAVPGPDGKVSTGDAIRIHRDEYERRVIASDPRAKAERSRRAMATRAA
jgi:hypothetical protein